MRLKIQTTSIATVLFVTFAFSSPVHSKSPANHGKSPQTDMQPTQPTSPVFKPDDVPAAQVQQPDPFWSQVKNLTWKFSPAVGQLGSEATIGLSPDLGFLGPEDSNRFLSINRNLPCRTTCYTLAANDLQWFAMFSFDPSGYVRDDEKIDPDALLETLKEGNRASLEERKRQGLPLLYLDGWYVEPHYDVATKRLEWGTRVHNENGNVSVNYSTRLLGRNGVMSATLVSSPETFDADLRNFKGALNNFNFETGKSYAEYRQGDKVAEYGLTALVVGGAAAAAAKSGLGKGLFAAAAGFGKVILVGGLALVAGLWNFVKRLFSRNQ